jgi:NodT family efflux transporter outer membrane factor (OMF) lipoprotein
MRTRRLRLASLSALAALLAGCTVGPDFAALKADAPAAWTQTALPAAAIAPADGRIVAGPANDGAWWTGFGDPVLTSLIARTAAANLDLQEAALRIAEARIQTVIAGAADKPMLGGNASYSIARFSTKTAQGEVFNSIGGIAKTTGLPVSGLPNPYSQFQLGFDASWEPDFFGGVRRSVEAANADAQTALAERNSLLVSLEGEVARLYFDLRVTQEKLALARQNVATARDVLLLARQTWAAGLGTDLDVENAAAQATAVEAQLPLLEREIAADSDALSQILAREPGALEGELKTVKPMPPLPAEIAIGLPGDLAHRRPDILSAEARLHAATARVGVATADLYPRLTFSADLGTQAGTFPGLADWAGRFFNIGPSLEIPIFEGGRLRATVKLTDLEEKTAAIDYAKTVLAAVHEVEAALIAYRTERLRAQSLAATAAENKNALALARQRYGGGVTGFLDVLNAERSLEQTQLSLADSRGAVSTDLVAVYKALGGGWGN